MDLERKNIAGVQCIVKKGKPGGPAVCLFHGYGADANDLAPLSNYINLPSNVTWYFPQGPINLIVGSGMSGYAWFDIDVKAMELAMIEGRHRDLTTTRPPGLDKAKKYVTPLYEQIISDHDKAIIGGFSQGAMLSCEIVFTNKQKPKALVILSGALLDLKNWQVAVQSCEGLPYFQSHGINDALLSYKDAVKLDGLLQSAGALGHLNTFKGGHEIPVPVLNELKSFLLAAVKY